MENQIEILLFSAIAKTMGNVGNESLWAISLKLNLIPYIYFIQVYHVTMHVDSSGSYIFNGV